MSKMVCPLCGVFTTFSPVFVCGKGIVTRQSTPSTVIWDIVKLCANTESEYMAGEELHGQPFHYAIVECPNCKKWFVAQKKIYPRGDWSAVYPIPHTPVANEIPEPIKSEFEEARLCFVVGAYRACVAMCQIAMESTWRQQEASGLEELEERGIISRRLRDRANEIRLWAGMVKHKPIQEKVELQDADDILNYLNDVLDDIYLFVQAFAAEC